MTEQTADALVIVSLTSVATVIVMAVILWLGFKKPKPYRDAQEEEEYQRWSKAAIAEQKENRRKRKWMARLNREIVEI